MKLKLFSVILVLSLVLACGLVLVSCVDKGNEYIEKAVINLYLEENGDLKVEERWIVTVEGDAIHNLYREIDLYDSEEGHYSTLKDFSVKNNLTGEVLQEAYDLKNPASNKNPHLDNHSYVWELKSGATNAVHSVEIGYYMPYTSYDTVDYTMSYTITDMVVAYSDTVVLYYMPFAKGFEMYIDELELNLYLPGKAKTTADTLVYLHTELAESYAEVEADKITATVGGFQDGDSIEIRALLPQSAFNGVQKVNSTKNRQAIIDEETAWKEEYEATVLKERRTTVTWSIVGGVIVLLSVALAIYFKVFYYKVKNDGKYPTYVREIPAGMTPAEMAHYFYHYKGGLKNQKNRGNMLSATIMDLTRKGFISLAPDPTDPDDYVIEIRVVPDPKRAELKAHEVALLELLGKVQSSVGKPFNMKEFERFSKQNANYTNNQINAVVNQSAVEFRQASNFRQSKLTSFLITIGVLLIGCGVLFISGPLTTYFGVGLFISGFIVEIFTPRAKRFSEIGLQKYMQTKGLENFMLDFSNLKEHEIPALILWEEYMVFATMMGISERVLEELKLKYPEMSESTAMTSTYHDRSYLYFYLYMNRRRVGYDFGRSLNTALGNISRSTHHLVQASKAQSASGGRGGSFGRSGGGFRGGGGGFGGGGGGAR